MKRNKKDTTNHKTESYVVTQCPDTCPDTCPENCP